MGQKYKVFSTLEVPRRRYVWSEKLLCSSLLLATGVFGAACNRGTAQAGSPATLPPPLVTVTTTRSQDVPRYLDEIGRNAAFESVSITPQVAGRITERHFQDGDNLKKGQLLFVIDPRPYKAQLDAAQASLQQANAALDLAKIQFERDKELVGTRAISKQDYDTKKNTVEVVQAQIDAAKAAIETAQINLDYCYIRSPIDGRIGRTSVTIGNVVGPASGTLTTVVSQDPMYVLFPVPTRRAIELREEYAKSGGFDAVKVRVRLPDGRLYEQIGKVDFINNAIAQDTDTVTVRGVIPNPILASQTAGGVYLRELIADEFVTVLLESVNPKQVIAVPRAAILSDQEGSYVYVVDDHNIAHQRRVRLGEMTPEKAGIVDGLKEGEQVIVEGVQRARPNAPVTPAPVAPVVSRS